MEVRNDDGDYGKRDCWLKNRKNTKFDGWRRNTKGIMVRGQRLVNQRRKRERGELRRKAEEYNWGMSGC
jgi:hypothetical protein